MTPQQKSMLDNTSTLIVVDTLPDNDLLVIDKDSTEAHPYGPYVLTVDGLVQDVSYHYITYHGINR